MASALFVAAALLAFVHFRETLQEQFNERFEREARAIAALKTLDRPHEPGSGQDRLEIRPEGCAQEVGYNSESFKRSKDLVVTAQTRR